MPPRFGNFAVMTSLLKGLATLMAVLTVNLGGAHVAVAQKPVHHQVVVAKTIRDATTDPVAPQAGPRMPS